MKYIFKDFSINNKINYSYLRDKTIVIFGASYVGMVVLYALNKIGIKVSCFCDNQKDKQGKLVSGTPVFTITEVAKQYPDAYIFISAKQFIGIKNQLEEYGFSKFYDCVDILQGLEIDDVFPVSFDFLSRSIDAYMLEYLLTNKKDSLNVHSVDVVVTEKCSLKCRDCANLMQYYQKPIDCNETILFEALERFTNAVDYIHEFRVLGGEPFMSKILQPVLQKLCTFTNFGRIQILTNGTIVPDDKTLTGFDTSKIDVIIADYGVLSRNIERLIEKLDMFNIKHDKVRFEKWHDCATIKYIERTESEKKYLYYNCCAKDILTILHGKLYSCPFSAHACNLQAIPSNGSDEIDLLNKNISSIDLRDKIKKIYLNSEYVYACQYCTGRNYSTATIPAAIQIDSPIYFERKK